MKYEGAKSLKQEINPMLLDYYWMMKQLGCDLNV